MLNQIKVQIFRTKKYEALAWKHQTLFLPCCFHTLTHTLGFEWCGLKSGPNLQATQVFGVCGADPYPRFPTPQLATTKTSNKFTT